MIALITGASSGIGEAYATKFAELGYDLILTGRREDLLKVLSDKLRKKYNISVETLIVELSNDDELDRLANKIKQIENLQVLINNAGFGSRSHFLEEEYRGQENMIKVHVLAPMKLIYAAMPGMIKRDSGILINVSSISGKTPSPNGAIYNATKSFLQIFSESLYLENINSNITIQTLCPGFTRTDFHGKIGLNDSAFINKGIVRWMSPEQVVEISLKNLKKGKVICVPGFWNKVLWVLADFIPRNIYYKIVSRLGNRELLFSKQTTGDWKMLPFGVSIYKFFSSHHDSL